MGVLSILAIKSLIRETGARASDEGVKEMAMALEELARNLAERSKTLAEHTGRKTVKGRDVKQALKEILSPRNY
jgi:histone H3/H4